MMLNTKYQGYIFKEAHIKIIPVKFGQIPASSLDVLFLKQLLTTGDAHSKLLSMQQVMVN